jgi:hypothetical protein
MIQKFSILKEDWFRFQGIFLSIYLPISVVLISVKVEVLFLLISSFKFKVISIEWWLEVIRVFWEVFSISFFDHLLMVQASIFTLC